LVRRSFGRCGHPILYLSRSSETPSRWYNGNSASAAPCLLQQTGTRISLILRIASSTIGLWASVGYNNRESPPAFGAWWASPSGHSVRLGFAARFPQDGWTNPWAETPGRRFWELSGESGIKRKLPNVLRSRVVHGLYHVEKFEKRVSRCARSYHRSGRRKSGL
jgi:hypothetical protein